MAERLTVATIVAVKNGEKYIRRALDSIVKQSRPPDEILIVDGRSTDATCEIARSYDNVCVMTQPGLGIADAYNAGVLEARSDLVAFLSHDDEWTTDKLAVQAAIFETEPGVMLSTAKARFVAENPDSLPPGFRPELLQGSHTAHVVETLVARRELFRQIGLFDTSFNVAEDVEWFARVKDAGINWRVARQVLLTKHIHRDNASLNLSKNHKDLLRAIYSTVRRKREKQAGDEHGSIS
jgi:glycosyltransferase involved in cell wall biosynthesis